MIAKRILSPKGGSGFSGLARYVVNARSSVDPASWERLGAYILDENGQGEKVAWARVTNCLSDDPGWAVKEILATQAQNTRSRSDKSYHLVISFPEGEKPSREQVEDIEDTLCGALGFETHERISAVHQNTDNWHLHVAINKVNPTSFRNVTPIRDYYRLQEACAELEVKHGLTREPHTVDRAGTWGRKTRGRAADFEAMNGGQSFVTWIREQAGAALLVARDSGKGWEELHRVAARFDLVVKPRGAGLVFGHAKDGKLHVKASDIDRGLSLSALESIWGPFQAAREPGQEPAGASYARPEPTGPLYARFKEERDAAEAARKTAIAGLLEQHKRYGEALRNGYREVLESEYLQPPSWLRKQTLDLIRQQRKDRMGKTAEKEARERRETRDRHPIPTWQSWLEREAGAGDVAALAELRKRHTRRETLTGELLSAADETDARQVIHRHLRPGIRRDGRVVYSIDDGGTVVDSAKTVGVPQVSPGSAFLALTLAIDRFGAQPLNVNGTDEFRALMAETAGRHGLAVSFKDPAVERSRIHAAAIRASLDRLNARSSEPDNPLGRD